MGDTAQAKLEEERMMKLFGKRSPTTPTAATPSAAQAKAAPAPAKLPEVIDASQILAEVNAARADPAALSRKLTLLAQRYKDKCVIFEDGVRRDTEEGANAVVEAAKAFANASRAPALSLSMGLSKSARDLTTDQAISGRTGSELSDGTDVGKRFARYGAWRGRIAECVVYGARNAADAVLQLAIDDGSANRANRAKLLEPDYCLLGVNCGPHKTFGNVVSLIFAQEFVEGGGAASASAKVQQATAVPPAHFAESPEKDSYTADLCPLTAPPESVTVFKKGAFLVLKVLNGSDLQEQRWRLPIPASAESITAKITGGRLVLAIAKEQVAGDSGDVIVDKHRLEIDPAAAAESRPEAKLGPATAERIVATVSASAVVGSVSLKLIQAEAARTTLSFEVEYSEPGTDKDGKYVRNIKSGQTVKLPFKVGKENITVEKATPQALVVVVVAPTAAAYDQDAKEEPVKVVTC